MVRFTDTHRLFLQACVSRRIVTEEDAIDLLRQSYRSTTDRDIDEECNSISSWISDINQGLDSLGLELRRGHSEARGGRVVYALVNRKGDEIAQLATEFTPNEMAYFKKILEIIICNEDEEFSVGSMVAVREGTNQKVPISRNDTEELLQRFVDHGWLIKTSDGKYAMSTRCILELQSFFKDNYEGYIRECTLCYEYVTIGQRCATLQCPVRIHHPCSSAYFNRTGNQTPRCPQCNSLWDFNLRVGVDPTLIVFPAEEEQDSTATQVNHPPLGEATSRRSTSAAVNTPRRSTRETQEMSTADTEEMIEDETPIARKTRSQIQRSASRR
ncbi:uncharacterized protein VTP21DRAFT_9198 [Calcarisporiella thermophila]|uniref:uncharacterized protein n=1 Tax=Calcarisporiella thermophila TaxID=911321 RepID=UPI003743B50A